MLMAATLLTPSDIVHEKRNVRVAPDGSELAVSTKYNLPLVVMLVETAVRAFATKLIEGSSTDQIATPLLGSEGRVTLADKVNLFETAKWPIIPDDNARSGEATAVTLKLTDDWDDLVLSAL
jgi:hypothetical protein